MNERRRRQLGGIGVVVGLCGLGYALVHGCRDDRHVVHVLAADVLATSIARMEEVFERENPDIDLRVTVEGSVMLLRMHVLHPADVVALSDYRLIEVGLRPENADWAVKFATTEVVMARTQASRYADVVTQENWPEILLRPDVIVGHPDPTVDPCGYYTRLAWKLAEHQDPVRYAGLADSLAAKASAKYQRPDALTTIGLLQSRTLDYAFVYRSHATDHHLPYIRLGDAVSLGQPALEREYSAVSVDVPDYRGTTATMQGHPVYLALTIAKQSRHAAQAERFVRFMLSPQGQAILRRSDFLPLVPARAPSWSTNLPGSLAELVTIEPASENGTPGQDTHERP